jgi:hypothetical protein
MYKKFNTDFIEKFKPHENSIISELEKDYKHLFMKIDHQEKPMQIDQENDQENDHQEKPMQIDQENDQENDHQKKRMQTDHHQKKPIPPTQPILPGSEKKRRI